MFLAEIIIIESKQFKYTRDGAGELEEFTGVSLGNPNPNTGLPPQMSDGWIDYVAGKLNDEGGFEVSNMIILNRNKVTKYVSAIDKSRGEINILKLGIYDL